MKSVMKHDFSRIPMTAAPRSTFDRSHGLKTAFNSGYLVPIEVQEVLPGDEVSMSANMLGRIAPVVTPIMDNVYLDTQWFFVPSRLLWTNFTKMMGERVNPKDSIDFLVPQLNSGDDGFAEQSLADYFGIPTKVPDLNVNALPFRAYAKIWDDWYRDENLQDSIIQSSDDLGDSNGTIPWNTLLRRGKRHDYFTSALPWPQKGDGVELPLVGSAPVYGDGKALALTSNGTSPVAIGEGVSSNFRPTVYDTRGNEPSSQSSSYMQGLLGVPTKSEIASMSSSYRDMTSGLTVDLSGAASATINSLRMAFQLQRMLETDARSGTRFVELIRAHFKTICPDARLQRSEYLGGSSELISFNPVAQTSASGVDAMGDEVTPQGNLVANGKVFSRSTWHKSFTEHGYIIGLANVRCDLNYQQGLNRMWSRRGRYDFFWPTLQNLGEQVVTNREIYAQGDSVVDDNGDIIDDQPFGYQERYAEYRYNPSIITGRMRSNATNSLDVWHLAQQFSQLPTLSKEFIVDTPPLPRVLAVGDAPEIILDCYLAQKWTRAMATYSVPGLIDHL